MWLDENIPRRARRSTRTMVAGVLGLALLGTALVGATAEAAKTGFPKAYAPETAPSFTNTFTPDPTDLKPACPQALAGTPGSDPASKVVNTALPNNFDRGGTVHFTYRDNPHTNGGTANFTIQDCVVSYPANTFVPGDFGPDGVLINATKSTLKGGTQVDGAELNGISAPTGPIYFTWTIPTTVDVGSWLCTFARDIRNNHGGGGNRKVPPTCFQVTGTPPPTTLVRRPAVISLAYADNFHGSTGVVPWKPTPWQGDPGVVFVGCATEAECGKFDGGAIMIANPAENAGALTLVEASVTIGACFFHPWDALLSGSGQTALPGQKLILTQTALGGAPMPAPCREAIDPAFWDLTNFDTSERPGDTRAIPDQGVAEFFNCDAATGPVPMIKLRFSDDTELTVPDTQKILNTGGTDAVACNRGNEATPWTVVT